MALADYSSGAGGFEHGGFERWGATADSKEIEGGGRTAAGGGGQRCWVDFFFFFP
jgi:hypothetical protein